MSDADLRLSLALALIAVVYLALSIQVPTVVSWWHARGEARKRAREREEPAADLPAEY